MKQVKAIHATPENFKDFGVVTRLTDNDCFQGEGWKCWKSSVRIRREWHCAT